MFNIGELYSRQALHDKYGGNRQSGIASCANFPFVFLFSSPRGEEYGYKDGWQSVDRFRYTGEGPRGDMDMARGNLAIREHVANGKQLHLFIRRDSGRYEYAGEFQYEAHHIENRPDEMNRSRKAIIFTLRRVDQK